MKFRILVSVAALAAALQLAAPSRAQQPAPDPPSPSRAQPVVQVGGDVRVADGDRVEDVVVIRGDAVVAGHVEGDLVGLFSAVRLSSTAEVDGEVVVVGGAISVEPGARVGGDLVLVGGSYALPDGFTVGGERVLIGVAPDWPLFGALLDWFSEGPLLGRLIVPGLAWIWMCAALLLAAFLLVQLVFEDAVRTCAGELASKPLTALLAGLLAVLLIGPLAFALATSVVGLPVVPVLLLAFLFAGFFGHAAVARWIGSAVLEESSPGDRLQAARSLSIGFAVLCLAYALPVLGLAAWTLAGVLGLGAVTATSFRALRAEHRRPPRPPDPAMGAAEVSGPEEDSGAASAGAPAELPAAAPVRAGFSRRLGSVLLDAALLVLICGLLSPGWQIAVLIALGYHIGLWSWISTTVGGIICRVRVVRGDGGALQFADAMVRGLACIFSVAVAGLGWFWCLWDEQGQGWHDRIAGTYVVRSADQQPAPPYR